MSSKPADYSGRNASAPLLLLAIVALGIAGRAPRLVESLWYDEIAAWRDYGARGAAFALTHYHDPANHVLHTALTSWSVSLAAPGWSVELALRLPALLFSIATIIIVFALGRRVAGPRFGVICGALSAVLPIMVLEGVEARGYSMMICAAAASTWILWELLHGRRSVWLIPVYAVSTTIGIWAHLMTVFVPIGHAVYLLWLVMQRREQRRAALLGLGSIALAAALTIAAYAPILDDLWRIRATFEAQTGDQPRLLGPEGLHALLGLGGAWTWWAAGPGLALFICGLTTSRHDATARRIALLSLLGLPIMLGIVLLAGTWVYARFTVFVLPGVILIMSFGIDRIWRVQPAAGIGALAVLVAVSITNLITLPPKQPLRDAVRYVRAQDPAQSIVVIGLRHNVLDVYAGDLELRYSGVHGAQLDTALGAAQPSWIILYYPRSVEDDQYELLERNGFELRRRFHGWVDWSNGDVLVYERAAP